MNEYLNKDLLYYSDLIYKIKSLAGFSQIEDAEVEKRILKREEMIANIEENNLITYNLSIFELEVVGIVRGISIKVNKSFSSLYEIAKYPKQVEEALVELEKKKLLLANMRNAKGITIDFAEKYKNLICKDIVPKQLQSYPYRTLPPEKYRKTFIHSEDGFAYLYCMSEEEQEEVRKARKRTLQNSDNK